MSQEIMLSHSVLLVIIKMRFKMEAELGTSTLQRLIFSDSLLNGGLIIGTVTLLSFVLSIYAIVTGMKDNKANVAGLRYFAVSIILSCAHDIFAIRHWSAEQPVCTAIATTAVGLAIWFWTLRPRAEYAVIWQAQNTATQQALQDHLKCCGYFSPTAEGFLTATQGFCANVVAGTNTTVVPGCITSIVGAQEYVVEVYCSTLLALKHFWSTVSN